MVAAASAFLIDSFRSEKWDGLKVTWGPNPLSSSYFVSMPRTASDAVSKGFKKIDDCNANGNYRGARYIKDNDFALVLLYDVNGYIAGIQTALPDNIDNGYPKSVLRPPFVQDGDKFLLTAYFIDPSVICTTGRSKAEFDRDGTGTNLYIQNGTVAEKDSILVPFQEQNIQNTKWTKGKCFVSMGQHYWYDLSDDMSCDRFFPVFLLYNGGELNGFGWALGADLTSKHYEHPPASLYSLFMVSPPKCLAAQGTMSTMHIYLTSSVALDLC